MNPTDRFRNRMVSNLFHLIREHLESMQRDVHGLEYEPWKGEVDALWKRLFEQIGFMSHQPQQQALELIRELWTIYVAHYAIGDREKVETEA